MSQAIRWSTESPHASKGSNPTPSSWESEPLSVEAHYDAGDYRLEEKTDPENPTIAELAERIKNAQLVLAFSTDAVTFSKDSSSETATEEEEEEEEFVL